MPVPHQQTPTIRRSASENRLSPQVVSAAVVALILMFAAGYFVWSYDPGGDASKLTPTPPTATVAPVVNVARALNISQPATPQIIERVVTVQVFVTVQPTVTPLPTQTPSIIYYETIKEVPVQVEKIIEVTAIPTQVVVPIGQIMICLYGGGFRELYIDDRGVTGGSCSLVAVPATDNSIQLQVKR